MSTENPSATATVEDAPAREVLGWLEFGDASRQLAYSIAESGFSPEIVVAIARGGLLLAGSVAYALGVKSCGSLNVEFYTGVDERLEKPEILPPLLDGASLAGKRVLLVDDVSDSGRTLALAVELLRGLGAEVRSVTLYVKPRTILEPDYCWRRTDHWIAFPWSSLPPVTEEAERAVRRA
jgi:hypoxanthine phosphoribosyltransferase